MFVLFFPKHCVQNQKSFADESNTEFTSDNSTNADEPDDTWITNLATVWLLYLTYYLSS